MNCTRLFATISVATLAFLPLAQAATLTLDASDDTYIRSSSGGSPLWRNRNFNAEKLISGAVYIPLVQFDLSSVVGRTITSASMRGYLYEDPDGDFADGSYAHQLILARTNPSDSAFDGGMNEATMTYNIYAGIWNDDEVLMEDLGEYSEPGNGVPNSYKDFGSATAADLAELNGRASLSNPNQRFALFYFNTTDPFRYWENHEGGQPMQLVLNVVPEPSSLGLATLIGLIGLCLSRRGKNNC